MFERKFPDCFDWSVASNILLEIFWPKGTRSSQCSSANMLLLALHMLIYLVLILMLFWWEFIIQSRDFHFSKVTPARLGPYSGIRWEEDAFCHRQPFFGGSYGCVFVYVLCTAACLLLPLPSRLDTTAVVIDWLAEWWCYLDCQPCLYFCASVL